MPPSPPPQWHTSFLQIFQHRTNPSLIVVVTQKRPPCSDEKVHLDILLTFPPKNYVLSPPLSWLYTYFLRILWGETQSSSKSLTSIGSYFFLVSLLCLLNKRGQAYIETIEPPHYPYTKPTISLEHVTVIKLDQTNGCPNANTAILLLCRNCPYHPFPFMFLLTVMIQRGVWRPVHQGLVFCTSLKRVWVQYPWGVGRWFGIWGRVWSGVYRKRDRRGEANGTSCEIFIFSGGKRGQSLLREKEQDMRRGPCRRFCHPLLQQTRPLPQEAEGFFHTSEGDYTKVLGQVHVTHIPHQGEVLFDGGNTDAMRS